MLCIFADTPVVSPEGKIPHWRFTVGPLTSVMDRNGETLFTPVVELLLLTRRRRFTGPDEDFCPGRVQDVENQSAQPARRYASLCRQDGPLPATMRTVVALPPNQQRIPAFSRLTRACNGKLNQDTVQQARHVTHRILVWFIRCRTGVMMLSIRTSIAWSRRNSPILARSFAGLA